MIIYDTDNFGFRTLFRLHGSSVFKSIIPALISSVMYYVLRRYTDLETDEGQILEHPYAMGAMVAALAFLLSFRANFSYNRYWEAFTAVHQMHSKWLDVGMDVAAFHLQSSKYEKIRPPAFGEYPQLTCLERERERNEPTMSELEEKIDEIMAQTAEQETNEDGRRKSVRKVVQAIGGGLSRRSGTSSRPLPWNRREEESRLSEARDESLQHETVPDPSENSQAATIQTETKSSTPIPPNKQQRYTFPSMFVTLFKGGIKSSTDEVFIDGVDLGKPVNIKTNINPKRAWEVDQPPLLLQEAAHLLSLLSAVALSTLRNDLEEAEAPLTSFTPGEPWPHVDPDAYGADVRKDWELSTHRTRTILAYLFGLTRTPASRTLYNAARPLRVIGGVSDAEIETLQAARGPYAKVALCTMWVQEFISREHLNGGMGEVGAPIISRVYQFTSDGMLGYNQARKIAYIPFPFPHAQITRLFVILASFLLPVLMLSFTNNIVFGFVLNLLTVMSFVGVHEVAIELEAPFRNAPNDMPLNNFQAQYNEALMQMFAGFHPDAYWEILKEIKDESEEVENVSSFPPTAQRIEMMEQENAAAKDTADSPGELVSDNERKVRFTSNLDQSNTNKPPTMTTGQQA